MCFVSFLGEFIAGRPFYSKDNASALNFAVQEDDKFDAYSTSLFFPPVHVFCVFSWAVYCREALLHEDVTSQHRHKYKDVPNNSKIYQSNI